MSNVIRSDKEELAQIARVFAEEGQKWEGVYRQLQTQTRTLEAGAWIGKGARMFQTEMQGEVFQAYQRLISALREASTALNTISRIFDEGEQEGKSFATFVK